MSIARTPQSGSNCPSLALAGRQSTGGMTPLALFGRRLVEKNFLSFDHTNLFVAAFTLYVLVQPLQ